MILRQEGFAVWGKDAKGGLCGFFVSGSRQVQNARRDARQVLVCGGAQGNGKAALLRMGYGVGPRKSAWTAGALAFLPACTGGGSAGAR